MSLDKNPNFQRWFGESQVVDARGKPLVVYHGTHNDSFTQFEPGRCGAIYFTPDMKHAREYGPTIIDVCLRIEKLADLTDTSSEAYQLAVRAFNESGGWSANEDAMEGRDSPDFDPARDCTWEIFDSPYNDVRHALMKAGYDGFKLQEYDGQVSFVVLKPEQIKSATCNAGTFDPNNPDITDGAGFTRQRKPSTDHSEECCL